MFPKKIFILISIFLIGSAIFAQNDRRRRTIIRRPPTILIEREGKKVPLGLDSLKIDIQVQGNLAKTTMEMIFHNKNNRILEGQLVFPLGEGKSVSRFAMEVNGKLREGVVVPKAKGRKAFEEVVRRNIDPGLLEWTKGNNFKARIYPIPARGYKRVVIAYHQELLTVEKGFLYQLPMSYSQTIPKFSIRAEVIKQRKVPVLPGKQPIRYFRFKKWRESYIAQAKKRNFKANKPLKILLPKTAAYKTVVVERDGKENFFYLHTVPQKMSRSKKLPSKLTILWDASGSTEKRDLEKELKLLGRYFSAIKNCDVTLVPFSDSVDKAEKFQVENGSWENLKTRLEKMTYDGGTQLGAINLKSYPADEILLFSDGISNFGESKVKFAKTPVMVINSQATAEHSTLKYIARRTGGIYLNLNEVPVDQAIESLKNQPFQFIRAEYSRKEMGDVYPSFPVPVHKDFSLAGKLYRNKATIKLHFGFGKEITKTIAFTVQKRQKDGRGTMVSRIWAQKKISQLDMQFEQHQTEILTLGQNYHIITRNTSMIILDRIQDYVKHRILPPTRELQSQYLAMINQIEREKKKKTVDHIETVVQRFQESIDWWNKKFSLGPRPQPKIEKKKMARNGRNNLRESESEERNVGASDRREVRAMRREEARPASPTAKKSDMPGKGASGEITLAKWNPKTPYIERLKNTDYADLYSVYLKEKKKYPASSAFFLDVSDFFMEKQQRKRSLRVLSNIAEMKLENPQLLRILAHRLSQLKYYKLSIAVFKEVLKMREEEPQSYRDLALVYEKDGQYQKAIKLLYDVVKRPWDSRFPDIEIIALKEMNSIIARFKKQVNTSFIDKRLIKNLPVDVRVILNWDADNTDMDLWVTDPNKEKCYYGHPRTYVGGFMSKDFTGGYGPEEYWLKVSKGGKYLIQINYYGNRQQILAGATTVQIQLFMNFGRKNQTMKEITMRLKNKKEVIKVGEFIMEKNPRELDL